MRITAGNLKGRKLKTPGKLKIRPPLDQLKQSVFNILAGEIEGKEVLDLYAGTGSFGLEALSRGAAGAVFVESAFKACRLLKENLKLLDAEENSSVMCAKVSQALASFKENGRKFNLVFVDPPFLINLCQKTLDNLRESNLLAHNAIIIVHHHQKEKVESPSENLFLIKSKKFGDNLVSIFLFSGQK